MIFSLLIIHAFVSECFVIYLQLLSRIQFVLPEFLLFFFHMFRSFSQMLPPYLQLLTTAQKHYTHLKWNSYFLTFFFFNASTFSWSCSALFTLSFSSRASASSIALVLIFAESFSKSFIPLTDQTISEYMQFTLNHLRPHKELQFNDFAETLKSLDIKLTKTLMLLTKTGFVV